MSWALEDGFSLFSAARFFGGTANGISENINQNWTDAVEPYTKNNISSLTFSAGLSWQQ